MPGSQAGDVPVKDYVDAKVAELEAAIGLLKSSEVSVGVPLREHIEARFEERDRAADVAEQEREKAARALRIELDRAIAQGDEALKDHIENQIQQIRAALMAADELERSRIEVVTARLNTQFEGAQEAIKKSEAAVQKEFTAANEWRAQSAERERTRQEEMAKFTAEFIRADVASAQFAELRKVAEAQFADMRRSIQETNEKVNTLMSKLGA